VLVLEAVAGGPHAPCDLVRLPAGARLDGEGIRRALVFASEELEPDAAPAVWRAAPAAPFPPFEDVAAGELPYAEGGIALEPVSDAVVAVSVGGARTETPRYWLARMLYRCALHGLRLGYVETYGGVYVDDGGGGGRVRVGIRAGAAADGAGPGVDLARTDALRVIERLYRAVAPAGYRERID